MASCTTESTVSGSPLTSRVTRRPSSGRGDQVLGHVGGLPDRGPHLGVRRRDGQDRLRDVGSVTISGALTRASRARTVSRPGSPGPLPTNSTRPGATEGARFISELSSRQLAIQRFGGWRRGPPGRAARRRGPARASRRRSMSDVAEARSSAPSSVPSTARSEIRSIARPSSSRSETTSASAPTGALQPASRAASRARSAVTAARVYSSSSTERSAAASSWSAAVPARHSTASAPWAGAGSICSGSSSSVASSTRPEPAQPGGGHHHGVQLAGGDLADPGVHVAADRDDLQAEPERVELGPAPRRAGADPGSGGQLAEHLAVAGDQRVARVLPGRHRGQAQPRVRRGGQVLVGVHGHVDLAAHQRLAQRRDEHADAELGDRGGRQVAGGADLDQLDRGARPRAAARRRCRSGPGPARWAGCRCASGAGHDRSSLSCRASRAPSTSPLRWMATAALVCGSSSNRARSAAA